MSRLVRVAAALLLGFVVGSCVRTSADMVTADTAIIEGRGSAFDDQGDVAREMMRSAAEQTLAAGFDYFAIEGSDAGYTQSIVNTSPGTYQGSTTGTVHNYGNWYSGSASTYGTYTPPTFATISKPRGALQIRMFKGQAPAGVPGVYDARRVLHDYDVISGN